MVCSTLSDAGLAVTDLSRSTSRTHTGIALTAFEPGRDEGRSPECRAEPRSVNRQRFSCHGDAGPLEAEDYCYPADLDLWQAMKALVHGALMARGDGTLILLTPCPEGVASQHPIVLQLGDASPTEVQRKMKQMDPADLIGAATHTAIGAVRERVKVVIVSDGLKEEEARRLGFQYAPHLQEALRAALTRHGAGTKVGVLTHGGDVAPLSTM